MFPDLDFDTCYAAASANAATNIVKGIHRSYHLACRQMEVESHCDIVLAAVLPHLLNSLGQIMVETDRYLRREVRSNAEIRDLYHALGANDAEVALKILKLNEDPENPRWSIESALSMKSFYQVGREIAEKTREIAIDMTDWEDEIEKEIGL